MYVPSTKNDSRSSNGLAAGGVRRQAWEPEFDLQDPNGRREPTPANWPLTLHMYARRSTCERVRAHVYAHTHTWRESSKKWLFSSYLKIKDLLSCFTNPQSSWIVPFLQISPRKIREPFVFLRDSLSMAAGSSYGDWLCLAYAKHRLYYWAPPGSPERFMSYTRLWL